MWDERTRPSTFTCHQGRQKTSAALGANILMARQGDTHNSLSQKSANGGPMDRMPALVNAVSWKQQPHPFGVRCSCMLSSGNGRAE